MRIAYQDLVEGVRDRAGLDDAHQAREITGAVLGTLVRSAPEDERRTLIGAVPAPIGEAVEVPVGSGPPGPGELLGEIGRLTGRTPEQARYLAQAVLAELTAQDPEFVERINTHLPSGTVDALREAGDTPGGATTTTPERPTALTGDEVAAALRDLPDWTGDRRGIARTVTLPDDRLDPLVRQVEAEARRSNDHVRADLGAGAVTFTLHTHGSEVTQPDMELAHRIDTVVAGFGSGG